MTSLMPTTAVRMKRQLWKGHPEVGRPPEVRVLRLLAEMKPGYRWGCRNMARKHDQFSKPHPKLSPQSVARRVVVPHLAVPSVGHSVGSRRLRRRRNGDNLLVANGASLRAPGAMGPPVTAGISPGGWNGMS
jgi:hypothetical protein